MDNLIVLNNWLEKHSNDQENGVLLLEFSKICRLCLKESLNMYGIRNHLVEFEEGSLFLQKVITNLIDEDDECDDDFPQNICFKCSELILQYYEFKIRCKKTRDALSLYNKIISQDVVRDLDPTTGIKVQNAISVELNQQDQQEATIDFDNFNDCSTERPASSQDNKSERIDDVIKIELLDPMNDAIQNADHEKLPSVMSCKYCAESFVKRSDLNKHLKTIHKDKTLVCDVCNQAFTHIQTLKRHTKIHQSDQRNKLCPFCGKCFLRTDDLRRHVRIHTNERPYACDKCDKKYKQTSELKEHMKSHSGLKSYMCNVCGKTLATRNGIYVHMKVHNGIKNHECQTCGTKYVTAGQLASHIKHIHSKQKPFACSYENCSKRFVTNIALRAHVRAHADEKPFECSICENMLSSSSKLSECSICVKMLSSSSKLSECSICVKMLSSSSKLSAHKRSHGTTADKAASEKS